MKEPYYLEAFEMEFEVRNIIFVVDLEHESDIRPSQGRNHDIEFQF